MKRVVKSLTAIFVVLSLVIPAVAQSDAEVVASFKKHLADYATSFKTDRRERVRQTWGGWRKNYYGVGDNYSIDLHRTVSLISPYVGTVEFQFGMHSTAFHKTREEAEADNNFISYESLRHRHNYAYQDGVWVLNLREEYSSVLDQWFNCDKDESCQANDADERR
jgi:hypothetical protein